MKSGERNKPNSRNASCVGSRHYCGTVRIESDITKNREKFELAKVLDVTCLKSMAVRQDGIKTQGKSHLFKIFWETLLKQVKI